MNPTAPGVVFGYNPDEIARRGNLVGDVLRPALREGKVIYLAGNSRKIIQI